ncbi:MAG: ribonuclease P, partial [Rikenellaceae bacterium]|nr:ribonuclease P [Rikenellaceae bacterium]
MAEQTLTRAERLRSLKVIRRLFEEGRGGFVYPFRYIWLVDECAEGETTGVEVLFSVPKRFLKRANKRHFV